jgi:glycosyltransferase involved in cell wall biosynthesis
MSWRIDSQLYYIVAPILVWNLHSLGTRCQALPVDVLCLHINGECKVPFKSLKISLQVPPLLVGGGPERNKLMKACIDYGIQDHVLFTGEYPRSIENICRFIDLFVFPTLYEGLPYSISEAMAYRLPIISTDVGVIPEQIQTYVSGFLVKKANAIALAAKITWLMEHREIWGTIGLNARSVAIPTLSIDKMVELFFRLFV